MTGNSYFDKAKSVRLKQSNAAMTASSAMLKSVYSGDDQAQRLSEGLSALARLSYRSDLKDSLDQAASILVAEVSSWGTKPYLVIKVDSEPLSKDVFKAYTGGSFLKMSHLHSLNDMVLVSLGGPRVFLSLFRGVLLMERTRRGLRLVEQGIGTEGQIWIGLTPQGQDIYINDEKDREDAVLNMFKTWAARGF